MKNCLLVLIAVVFLCGCPRFRNENTVVVKINNYEITKSEFEQEFKNSVFGKVNTPESRKEFLNNLIDRKLILQDAEHKDIDKDPAFLASVQYFWEESLLRFALKKKAQGITRSIFINDKLIENAYQKLAAEGKADKPYNQMYQELKIEITNLKESQRMNDWISLMRKQADIRINEKLLNPQQGGNAK